MHEHDGRFDLTGDDPEFDGIASDPPVVSAAAGLAVDEDAMPADSHVSRTVIEVHGEERPIFRRDRRWPVR